MDTILIKRKIVKNETQDQEESAFPGLLFETILDAKLYCKNNTEYKKEVNYEPKAPYLIITVNGIDLKDVYFIIDR